MLDAASFRKGLNETGYGEGQKVTVEHHRLEGHYDRLRVPTADLVYRYVSVISLTVARQRRPGNHLMRKTASVEASFTRPDSSKEKSR